MARTVTLPCSAAVPNDDSPPRTTTAAPPAFHSVASAGGAAASHAPDAAFIISPRRLRCLPIHSALRMAALQPRRSRLRVIPVPLPPNDNCAPLCPPAARLRCAPPLLLLHPPHPSVLRGVAARRRAACASRALVLYGFFAPDGLPTYPCVARRSTLLVSAPLPACLPACLPPTTTTTC